MFSLLFLTSCSGLVDSTQEMLRQANIDDCITEQETRSRTWSGARRMSRTEIIEYCETMYEVEVKEDV